MQRRLEKQVSDLGFIRNNNQKREKDGQWKDISSEFDAVKDTKNTRVAKSSKKFSEIFSNAYHLDPLIASKMWQYVIDTHENDREDSKRLIMLRVFLMS